jgi:hypothetical protein
MVNYIAILVAAVAGFAFGAVWYMALGKVWMAALGMTEHPKPAPAPFLIAFAAQLVMAWMLAGALGHLGDVSVVAGLITGRKVVAHPDRRRPLAWRALDYGRGAGALRGVIAARLALRGRPHPEEPPQGGVSKGAAPQDEPLVLAKSLKLILRCERKRASKDGWRAAASRPTPPSTRRPFPPTPLPARRRRRSARPSFGRADSGCRSAGRSRRA